MNDDTARHIISKIEELTRAVEYLGGPKKAENDLAAADCFVWEPKTAWLQPVPRPNRIDIGLIKGVDHVRDILQDAIANGYDAGLSIEPHMAVVFHDADSEANEDDMFKNYVEYGRKLEKIIEDIIN